MKHLVWVAFFWVVGCQTPRRVDAPPAAIAVAAPSPAAAQSIRLTVVATNDLHGWVSGRSETFPRGEIRYGGVAAFAGYLEVLRRENPDGVVLLDAGDLFQGTLVSNVTEGSVVIDALNHLRYDAAAIGNHEFDYGPVGPLSAPATASMDPFGALKQRVAQAQFPLLSANIYEAKGGERPDWLPRDGTLLLERKGIKIGIIGLTTPQTPTVTLPVNVESLKFRPLSSEALAAATRLRAQGAQVIIAVVHAGGKCGDVSSPADLSSCDTSSAEIFEMMRGLPFGALDAVVAGHTHARVGHFVNGAAVVESWAYGRHFGLIELQIDPATGQLLREQTQIQSGIEICTTWDIDTKSCDPEKLRPRAELVTPVPAKFRGEPIRVDEALLQKLRPAEAAVVELQHRPLALKVRQPILRAYEHESDLGNLVADSLRELARSDMGLMNAGGLRADLLPGELTYGSVYEVLPFDNTLAVLELNGAQLERLLARAFSGGKGVFQLSGLQVKLANCAGKRLLLNVALPGGKKVDAKKMYRLALPDFLARGGDGFGAVVMTLNASQVDLSPTTNLRDELIALWQRRGVEVKAPAPGRVLMVDDPSACSEAGKSASP